MTVMINYANITAIYSPFIESSLASCWLIIITQYTRRETNVMERRLIGKSDSRLIAIPRSDGNAMRRPHVALHGTSDMRDTRKASEASK